MEYRRIGDSELVVSEVSLGSWLTYSGGVEREKTEACTRAAFEARCGPTVPGGARTCVLPPGSQPVSGGNLLRLTRVGHCCVQVN